MKALKNLLILFLMLFTLGSCAAVEPEFTGPKVWTVSGMERVWTGEWERLDSVVKTDIFAARGEYEPFQLVVRAPRTGLSSVNVTFSDFTNATGNTIPAPTLYREHYVRVRKASDRGSPANANRPEGLGWYPDALIPFEGQAASAQYIGAPFNVDPRRNQPIWADVYVPYGVPAGEYSSRYTVSSAEGSVVGEISLTVFDFDLPKAPSLTTSFNLWQERTEAARAELLKHKLMPNVTPSDEIASLNHLGINASALGYFSGGNYSTCQMDKPPSVEELRAKKEAYPDDVFVYNYTADEVGGCDNLTSSIKSWARNMHAAGVKQLVTMMPKRALYDDGTGQPAVDIWSVSPRMYEETPRGGELIRDALEEGHEVWSYTALVWLDNTPKWAIDFKPMNFRILPGFLNHVYDMTGTLYWRVDFWTNDPWNNVTSPNRDYPVGEGMLVYPGRQAGVQGVVPSMRLKWIREGVEDYEYVQILKDLGQEAQAKEVMEKAAKSWRSWTKDYKVIEEVKQELAALIVRYQ